MEFCMTLISLKKGCHPDEVDFHSIIFQDGHSQHHQPDKQCGKLNNKKPSPWYSFDSLGI